MYTEVTLSSCLIWQIISFILPPDEYGCVYAWTTLGNIETDRLTEDADFGQKIIFSDEAHFDLGGYVNKQNCRIWGTENLHSYIEKPTHPKRVTVWCGFWSRAIIRRFSSKMSKERLLQLMAMVSGPCWTNFCSQKLKKEDIGNIWFQQDGATFHSATGTLDVLRSRTLYWIKNNYNLKRF